MKHRVPALRLCFALTIVWSAAALRNHWFLLTVVANAAYGLFLLSPLADHIEHKER